MMDELRRRWADPVWQAEQAEDALRRFGEARPCIAEGCPADRVPDGPPFEAGIDHDGVSVMMRRWTCAAGHRYDAMEEDTDAR
jgi:hypothetical protein